MIRSLIASVLALILAATSVGAAVMHAEMQGATQLQICSDSHDGSGLTVITLDATGKKITHRNCPDCTAAFAALPPDLARAIAPHHPRAQIFAQTATDATTRAAPTQTARDPPLQT